MTLAGGLPEVYVRGMGLSCALGQGRGACAEALVQGKINTVNLTLTGFNEPVIMPYYRIPDQTDLFEPSRFDKLIPAVAKEAISDAGLSPQEIKSLPIFVGSSSFTVRMSEALYASRLKKDPESALGLPWVDFQQIAATIQNDLGCHGETFAFNTACSSAANALISATRMLQLGLHQNALVLGIELANQTTLLGFSALQLLSKTVRPFDADRNGIMLGESVSAVLLSRQKGGHTISLRAGAIQCDTFSATTANPDGSTIAALMSEVMSQAGVDAGAIKGIKAHATSSPSNDASEAAGMHRVFNSLPPVCALKPYTGHSLGACGTVELILFCGALKEGFLPATPGFSRVDPSLRVTPVLERASAPAGHYLLNYFGFGGNNSSLLIEHRP